MRAQISNVKKRALPWLIYHIGFVSTQLTTTTITATTTQRATVTSTLQSSDSFCRVPFSLEYCTSVLATWSDVYGSGSGTQIGSNSTGEAGATSTSSGTASGTTRDGTRTNGHISSGPTGPEIETEIVTTIDGELTKITEDIPLPTSGDGSIVSIFEIRVIVGEFAFYVGYDDAGFLRLFTEPPAYGYTYRPNIRMLFTNEALSKTVYLIPPEGIDLKKSRRTLVPVHDGFFEDLQPIKASTKVLAKRQGIKGSGTPVRASRPAAPSPAVTQVTVVQNDTGGGTIQIGKQPNDFGTNCTHSDSSAAVPSNTLEIYFGTSEESGCTPVEIRLVVNDGAITRTSGSTGSLTNTITSGTVSTGNGGGGGGGAGSSSNNSNGGGGIPPGPTPIPEPEPVYDWVEFALNAALECTPPSGSDAVYKSDQAIYRGTSPDPSKRYSLCWNTAGTTPVLTAATFITCLAQCGTNRDCLSFEYRQGDSSSLACKINLFIPNVQQTLKFDESVLLGWMNAIDGGLDALPARSTCSNPVTNQLEIVCPDMPEITTEIFAYGPDKVFTLCLVKESTNIPSGDIYLECLYRCGESPVCIAFLLVTSDTGALDCALVTAAALALTSEIIAEIYTEANNIGRGMMIGFFTCRPTASVGACGTANLGSEGRYPSFTCLDGSAGNEVTLGSDEFRICEGEIRDGSFVHTFAIDGLDDCAKLCSLSSACSNFIFTEPNTCELRDFMTVRGKVSSGSSMGWPICRRSSQAPACDGTFTSISCKTVDPRYSFRINGELAVSSSGQPYQMCYGEQRRVQQQQLIAATITSSIFACADYCAFIPWAIGGCRSFTFDEVTKICRTYSTFDASFQDAVAAPNNTVGLMGCTCVKQAPLVIRPCTGGPGTTVISTDILLPDGKVYRRCSGKGWPEGSIVNSLKSFPVATTDPCAFACELVDSCIYAQVSPINGVSTCNLLGQLPDSSALVDQTSLIGSWFYCKDQAPIRSCPLPYNMEYCLTDNSVIPVLTGDPDSGRVLIRCDNQRRTTFNDEIASESITSGLCAARCLSRFGCVAYWWRDVAGTPTCSYYSSIVRLPAGGQSSSLSTVQNGESSGWILCNSYRCTHPITTPPQNCRSQLGTGVEASFGDMYAYCLSETRTCTTIQDISGSRDPGWCLQACSRIGGCVGFTHDKPSVQGVDVTCKLCSAISNTPGTVTPGMHTAFKVCGGPICSNPAGTIGSQCLRGTITAMLALSNGVKELVCNFEMLPEAVASDPSKYVFSIEDNIISWGDCKNICYILGGPGGCEIAQFGITDPALNTRRCVLFTNSAVRNVVPVLVDSSIPNAYLSYFKCYDIDPNLGDTYPGMNEIAATCRGLKARLVNVGLTCSGRSTQLLTVAGHPILRCRGSEPQNPVGKIGQTIYNSDWNACSQSCINTPGCSIFLVDQATLDCDLYIYALATFSSHGDAVTGALYCRDTPSSGG